MSNAYYKACPEFDRCNELIGKNIGTQSSLRSALKDTWNLLRRAIPLPNVKWATFFYDGIGVEKDADKAFYWTQRAAEHGDRDGQFNLAYSMKKGLGRLLIWKRQSTGIRKLRSRTMILPSQKCQDLNLGDE